MSRDQQSREANDPISVKDRFTLTEPQWVSVARSLQLSGRETQIVQSLFAGKKELATALELSISRHTVHAHVRRIYGKLGVGSRSELFIRIFEEYISLRSSSSDHWVVVRATDR